MRRDRDNQLLKISLLDMKKNSMFSLKVASLRFSNRADLSEACNQCEVNSCHFKEGKESCYYYYCTYCNYMFLGVGEEFVSSYRN